MKRILVIEDNAIFSLTLFRMLSLQNFDVVTAEDGLVGLELAEELKPDLILSDINMPNLNGYGLLKRLRENLRTNNIPFIFITSESDTHSRSRALQLGANDYLTKPVSSRELLEAIAPHF